MTIGYDALTGDLLIMTDGGESRFDPDVNAKRLPMKIFDASPAVKRVLEQLKRNGTAKNHKANGAGTSRVTEEKQETEQAKRADIFKHNHKARLGLGQLWPHGVG